MGKKSYTDDYHTIEQLREEIKNLKIQLQDQRKDSGNTKQERQNPVDPFAKARYISNFAYWSYSFQTEELQLSEEGYKIFEVPSWSKKITKEYAVQLLHPEDRKNIITELKRKIVTESLFEIESRTIVPDGSIKYILIKFLIERNESHKPSQLSGTITDISESRFAISKLKGNEELFRSLFNNLTDIFIIFEVVKDAEGNINDYIYRDVNPTFEMKMGVSKDDVAEKKLSLQASLFQQFHPLFKLTIIANQPQQDRFFIQSLDGFFDILIYSPSDNIIATIWRDVTLMVDAESSLRESEEKYRQIFSIGSDAMFMTDFVSGRILDANPTGCKMFGYSKEMLLKMTFYQLSATPEEFSKEIQSQKSILPNQTALGKNGDKFPFELSLSYFNWSGRKVFVASIRDISERLSSQEKLIKSEHKFKQLFDYSYDAILLIKNYKIIDFNQKSTSLFSLKPEQLINKTIWNLSPSKQPEGDDSRSKAVENIQNSLLGNQLQFEWVFSREDGTTFFADVKLTPITVSDEKVVQVIVRDISPQKETQLALKKREELWKTALQASAIGVWDWNLSTKEVYYSKEWKSILGYDNDEISNNFSELETRIHPDDSDNFLIKINDYLLSETDYFVHELRIRCKNGTYKWIYTRGKIFTYNKNGKPERFVGTIFDITREKIKEINLTNEIQKITFAGNISKIGYCELDLRNMLLSGSEVVFSMLGFDDMEQLSLRQLEMLIHPEDQKNFISQFINSTEKNNIENIFRVNVNNETKFISSKFYPVRNSKNVLVGYNGIFQDITALKLEDATLKNERNFYNSIIEKFSFSILVFQNNKVIFTNEKITELTGYTVKEIYSKNITPSQITVPEDRLYLNNTIEAVSATPSFSNRIEIRIETKNNRIKWIHVSISSLSINNETAFLAVMNDVTAQKKMVQELELSERQLNSIASKATTGIALVDHSGQIFFSNDLFRVLTGKSAVNEKKHSYETLFSEPDIVAISRGIEAMTLSISDQFSKEILLPGDKGWVLLTIKPVQSANNGIDYFIFYMEQIDTNKKIIQKLEQEKNNWNLINDNSPVGNAIFSHSQELICYNQRFIDDLRLDPGQPSKIHLSEISFFSNHLTQIVSTVLSGKLPYFFELTLEMEKVLEVVVVPGGNNGETFLIYTKEITERKNKIELLSQQLEKFQGIFENASLGIALIDKNRHIILNNQKFSGLLGYSTPEISFLKFDQLVETQFLSEILSNLSQLFTGIIPSFQQRMKVNCRNSENIWINATISQFKDNYGDTKYAILIIDDITQIKTEEHTLLSNERIQTLNFIASSFANEFNNLLMAIYGNAYLLSNQIDDKNLLKYTTSLLNSTKRASELTHRLLSFSANTSTMNIVFSIKEIINDALVQIKIPGNIKIEKQFTTPDEKLIGDFSQLRRAISNIIINAVEAMPEGGRLSIETSTVYFDSGSAENNLLSGKGKYLRIIISDTGTGISQNEILKIFDPFYTTKQPSMNVGLGLTIAQRLINQHEGVIKAYSEVNRGTSFNVYLPLKNIEKINQNVQPSEKLIIKGNANILLVDDEDVVRIITSDLLNELGYDVYSFSSGKKALSFYKENHPTIDLVLLDKQMPEMNGLEVFTRMREINPTVKAIILTGYNIDKEIENSIFKYSNGFIQKPVSIEKLSQTISEILYSKL